MLIIKERGHKPPKNRLGALSWSAGATTACALVQGVNLYQSDADRIIKSPHNRGVVPGRNRPRDRRFPIIWWCQTGRGDNTLLSLSPVIVRGNDGTVTVVKLKHRSTQWVGNAKACQCRSEGAAKRAGVPVLHWILNPSIQPCAPVPTCTHGAILPRTVLVGMR